MEDRFLNKFEAIPHCGCWIWTASAFHSGYGQYWVGGRSGRPLLAHRVSWESRFGPIPEGMMVLHKCDTKSCVNPDHLFLGTHQCNMDDKVSKGRQAKGEGHGNARLTADDVLRIRELVESGHTYATVVSQFGIGKSQVGRIASKRSWGHV